MRNTFLGSWHLRRPSPDYYEMCDMQYDSKSAPVHAPEGFCIETLMIGPASEYRLCKKSTHKGSAEQRIAG